MQPFYRNKDCTETHAKFVFTCLKRYSETVVLFNLTMRLNLLLPVKDRVHSGALSYLKYVQGCGEAQTGDGKNSAGKNL